MKIVTTAKGVQYREQEFIDAWNRKRICHKRLDTLPKEHATHCAVCGSPIEAIRSTLRFCSDACKMKDYRQRKASKKAA